MAAVRLRLAPGAGSPWVHLFRLRLLSGDGQLFVSAVSRGIRSRSVSSRWHVNVKRSYKTPSSEEAPLHASKRAYYDILQVSPTATQAQIKTAYYKQSFMYHPDKNVGSEHAAARFSQISEAYNVLGNKTLRKKYDGGILSEADVRGSGRSTAAKEAASRSSGDARRSGPSPAGSAANRRVFDFDAFYRAHYGEQLQRQKDIRARLQEIRRQKGNSLQNRTLGHMSEVAVGVMLAVAAAIVFSLRSAKGG